MIVFAILYGLGTILAFFGNLSVLIVVITQRSFQNMRYFLLASLALSDFLFAVLITSNRTIATAHEEWVFGTPWCHGAAYIIRVLHLSTVFHLCAVSFERYNAIIRKPLRYDGRITKKKFFLNITLLWIVPVVISLGPFFGWGDYVYNPDVFTCEQKWDVQTTLPLAIASFLVPLIVIFILNYKVLKVVHQIQRSVKVIRFQPNEMQDCHNQLQCTTEIQGVSHSEPQQQPQKDIQCLYENEPDDLAGGNCLEVFPKGNGNSAQSFNAAKGSKCQSSGKENGGRESKTGNQTMVNGRLKAKRCSDQKERGTELMGRYQPRFLAKMELQVHPVEDRVSTDHFQNRNLEDGNGFYKKSGSDRLGTEERNAVKQPGVIAQLWRKISMEKVDKPGSQSDGKPRLISQKRNRRRNGKVNPETKVKQEHESELPEHPLQGDNLSSTGGLERKRKRHPGKTRKVCQEIAIQKIEHTETEVKQEVESELTEHSLQGDDFVTMGKPERKKRRHPGKTRKVKPENAIEVTEQEHCESKFTEDALQGHDLARMGKPQRKRKGQPGKTRMRLGMLLKEGKAARDVLIIISTFIVCYLPLWIMAIYRSSGKLPSVEAIMATHFVYCSTTFWNPIIYSVRKKEFRKKLKTLMRL